MDFQYRHIYLMKAGKVKAIDSPASFYGNINIVLQYLFIHLIIFLAFLQLYVQLYNSGTVTLTSQIQYNVQYFTIRQ